MCVHVCSSVFLSIHPEHVSVTGCLCPGFACWQQRAVLDGSSLFSILLPLSLWGRSPLGKAPHSPARLGSFSPLRGLEAVPLDSGLSRHHCPGRCGHWLFPGRLPHGAGSCFCWGPLCPHRSLGSSICTSGNLGS